MVVYAPLLFVAAWFECRSAMKVRSNRRRGEQDDDTSQEWERLDVSLEAEGWAKKVQDAKPNVEDDTATVEVRRLRNEVRELKELILKLHPQKESSNGSDI